MTIYPVDNELNLFRLEQVFEQNFVDQILATDWLNLPWTDQWYSHMRQIWSNIEQQLRVAIHGYADTAFWINEPGFTCSLHTDGEMPGSLHLTWIGSAETHGTAFYWYKDINSLRYQVPMHPNAGYIMINEPSEDSYRKLLWHAMLTPVPENTFRLTSYTWIIPK